jgi:hypothetical protein
VIDTLDAAIKAVCPIDGVALLDKKSMKVRIDFAKEATLDQRAAAQSVIDNFDWTAPEQKDSDRELLKALAMKASSAWTPDDAAAAVPAMVRLLAR